MITKIDLLYDIVKPGIDSIYSDEMENPMLEEIIMGYLNDFMKNMDEDMLQDDLKSAQEPDPKQEALNEISKENMKACEGFLETVRNGFIF